MKEGLKGGEWAGQLSTRWDNYQEVEKVSGELKQAFPIQDSFDDPAPKVAIPLNFSFSSLQNKGRA